MNILIIEDDQFFAGHLSKSFRSNKLVHRVDVVHSFDGFLSVFSILEWYDIVLTDIRLNSSESSSGFDGFHIIRTIREACMKIPIIVISGRDDISRIQQAFELWANDYMVKWIRMKELELRVMHWFKYYHFARIQSSPDKDGIYIYKDLAYDVSRHEFSLQEQTIPLTKSAKSMLKIFFTNAEKLLSEEFIVTKMWGDITLDIRRNVRINISRLRTSLHPFCIDSWIQTIHGEWYIFSGK